MTDHGEDPDVCAVECAPDELLAGGERYGAIGNAFPVDVVAVDDDEFEFDGSGVSSDADLRDVDPCRVNGFFGAQGDCL